MTEIFLCNEVLWLFNCFQSGVSIEQHNILLHYLDLLVFITMQLPKCHCISSGDKHWQQTTAWNVFSTEVINIRALIQEIYCESQRIQILRPESGKSRHIYNKLDQILT